jgi:Domain of unknown function (DUF4159)
VTRAGWVMTGLLAAAATVSAVRVSGQPEPAFLQGGSAAPDDPQLAGLEWRFVRIRYHANALAGRRFRMQYWSEPWSTDGPAAEQNLTRRVRSTTAIQVGDPIVLTLEDPALWQHPWIYFVEPGNLELTEAEVPILREFLLRGGTATFDDFHGPFEWENVSTQLKRVFPDRPIIELDRTHPIFSCFYKLEGYPQIPGLGSFMNGRTWEKGGFVPHLRAILDDRERPMVLINWNTDMGDGWEWSNAEDYPGYIRYTREAYRMGINEIVYVLTH